VGASEKLDRELGGIPFVFLTILATLAYGEHYLVDLAAGFCFALIPLTACIGGESWRFALACGALGYLSWVALIRYRPELLFLHPPLAWFALFASVAIPLCVVYGSTTKQQ